MESFDNTKTFPKQDGMPDWACRFAVPTLFIRWTQRSFFQGHTPVRSARFRLSSLRNRILVMRESRKSQMTITLLGFGDGARKTLPRLSRIFSRKILLKKWEVDSTHL